MPRRTRNASSGPSVAPGLDLDALDAVDALARAGDDAGDDVAVAAEVLRRRLDDEVGAEVERPADVRRGERVVDDVASRRDGGRARRARRGRRGRSSGWRWSRRRGRRVGAAARAAATASRSVVSTRSTCTPKPPNTRVELGTGRAVRRDRRDDPVAGPEERGERGVDRAHARGEGGARLAAGQLGVGVAEGARGRVRDPAVGVAGPGGRRRPGRARRRRPRRTSRSGRSGRSSASGRRPACATRPGWRGSRSPLALDGRPRVGVAHGERCYTGVGGAARPRGRRRPSRGPCRPASRRTSRRRR